MKQIERIQQMEEAYNKAKSALDKLEEALEEYGLAEEEIYTLIHYYFSPAWRKDYEAEEKGKIPKDMPRGILGEDTLYDFYLDHKEVIKNMANYVAKGLREEGEIK
ncbi:MAG: DUF4298 domain-containing protein [Solobacterium sp.]|nr:DUF4298 domain-containing protein [Solobacterium sp.]